MRSAFEHKHTSKLRGRGVAQLLIFAVAVSLAVFTGLALTGCVYSSAITEIIIDQDPNNQLLDSPDKLYNNDPNAQVESDKLPQPEISPDTPKETENSPNSPSYGELDTDTDATTPSPKESPNGDKDVSPKDQDSSGNSDGGGSSKGSSDGQKNDPDAGKNPENQDKDPDESGSGTNSKKETKVYKDYGDLPPTPEDVHTVAAVGDAAVLVAVIGGSKDGAPLVAADSDFVNNSTIQRVLENKSVADVKALWKNDGSSKGDLKSIDELIKLKPDMVFRIEGSKCLTDSQEDKLVEAGISVYDLPAMTSAKKILNAVDIVANILEKGGNTTARQVADDYKKFHNDMVKDLTKANGGLAGTFNFNTGKSISDGVESAPVSLLIDNWDDTARYDDSAHGNFLDSSNGVGIATIGYKNSPLSYYMSVGGVVNNAATGLWKSEYGTAVVWQFSQTQASSKWALWKKLDMSKVSYDTPATNGFQWSLLYSKTTACGLGTRDYPAVIASSKKIQSAIVKNAKNEGGLYYPYPLTTFGTVSVTKKVGFVGKDSFVYSAVGTDSGTEGSALNDGTNVKDFDVLVNPDGLVGSWTKGSLESVLESSWICENFRDDSRNSKKDVKEFYKKFYDYDLSDSELAEIYEGSKD